MLEAVEAPLREHTRLLLMDTCAEGAGVALSLDDQVRAIEVLTPRAASAEIISAVRRLLQTAGWSLHELSAVGVVSGPGSFTGVRAGLAAAKGLCEATGLRMAAVSRLEVLQHAGVPDGNASGAQARVDPSAFAVLDAGRGEVYVREQPAGQAAREWLCSLEDLRAACTNRRLIIAEPLLATSLAARLGEGLTGCEMILCPLTVADALAPVRRCLAQGGSDAAMVDANYVRGENDIYRKNEPAASPARQRP